MKESTDAKNDAMVVVISKIPTVCAQNCYQIDLTGNVISVCSLKTDYFILQHLLGPRADNPTVYAIAQGRVKVSVDGPAATGTVQGGAKMETTVAASFEIDGMITLILERDFASFDNTQRIEDEVN